MSDFENDLRTLLHDAAAQAPTFSRTRLEQAARAVPATAPAPVDSTRHRGRWVLAVAAAAVLAVAGGAWMRTGGDEERPPSSAACPALLYAGTKVYSANGEPTRLPRPGRELTQMRVVDRPCIEPPPQGADQTPAPKVKEHRVPVYQLPGISSSTAFYSRGKVWVRTGFSRLPVSLRQFYAPVRCTGTAPRSYSGTLISGSTRITGAFRPVVPYTATFVADRGKGLELGKYSAVTLRIRVTAATRNGADPAFLRPALGHAHRATVQATCSGGRFVATGFALS